MRRGLTLVVLCAACAPGLTPELTSIDPAAVPTAVSTPATLRGKNLGVQASLSLDNTAPPLVSADWTVRIGTVTIAARDVTAVSAESLAIVVPARLPVGVHDVVATSPRGAVAELRAGLTVVPGAVDPCDAICGQGCDGKGCCAAACTASPCTTSCACQRCAVACNGVNQCSAQCDGQHRCDIDCDQVKTCAVRCTAGATCTLRCDRTNDCGLECRNSDCQVDCLSGTNCNQTRCLDGARCLVNCQSAAACAFAECTGGITMCPGKVLACNRPCP